MLMILIFVVLVQIMWCVLIYSNFQSWFEFYCLVSKIEFVFSFASLASEFKLDLI